MTSTGCTHSETSLVGPIGPFAETVHDGNVLRVRAAEHAPAEGLYLWIPDRAPGKLEKSLLYGLASINRFELINRFAEGATDPVPNIMDQAGMDDAPGRAQAACSTSGVHLVWGPPGTGKTRVIALGLQDLINRHGHQKGLVKDKERELRAAITRRNDTRFTYGPLIPSARAAIDMHLRNALPHTPETLARLDADLAGATDQASGAQHALDAHTRRTNELAAWISQATQQPQATNADAEFVDRATARRPRRPRGPRTRRRQGPAAPACASSA